MRDVGGDTEVVEVREDLRLPYKEGVDPVIKTREDLRLPYEEGADPRLPYKEAAGSLDQRGASLAGSRADLGPISGRSRADLGPISGRSRRTDVIGRIAIPDSSAFTFSS